MKLQLIFSCVLIALINVTQGAKILGVFAFSGRSHYILGNALMRALAEAGHDVTMISPFTEKDPPKNGSYRDIVLTGFKEKHDDLINNMNLFGEKKSGFLDMFKVMLNVSATFTENTLKHPAFKKLLQSNEKFDVVVVEQFMNDALKVLAHQFDAPLILFNPVGPNSGINSLFCNPEPLSYVPEIMLGVTSKMTFLQRLKNIFIHFALKLYLNLIYLPMHERIVERNFPNSPPLSEIMFNASLVLLNSHESLNSPVPLVPAMKHIGGYHVAKPKKLPKDFQDFLDNAKDGVILFSMGSNVKSKDLPKEKREAILKSFSKLKQKILWKFEDDVLPGQPSNVKISKWLPQQDILAHPNVKVFITHGGLLSTTETVYHGVPIVAIPMFGDQEMNARNAELGGYGRVLPFKEISEETLTSVVTEILTNPKYTETAKTKSKIMHDREATPADSAVYWTEYVIRHNGAKHLRVAGMDLPWYKYMLVDVFGFIFAVLLISAFITKKFFCLVVKKLFTKKTKVKKN